MILGYDRCDNDDNILDLNNFYILVSLRKAESSGPTPIVSVVDPAGNDEISFLAQISRTDIADVPTPVPVLDLAPLEVGNERFASGSANSCAIEFGLTRRTATLPAPSGFAQY
jgi:hypothetical protein